MDRGHPGVETYYGRLAGGFKALDALVTLAFDLPAEHPRAVARQSFFRAELSGPAAPGARAGWTRARCWAAMPGLWAGRS